MTIKDNFVWSFWFLQRRHPFCVHAPVYGPAGAFDKRKVWVRPELLPKDGWGHASWVPEHSERGFGNTFSIIIFRSFCLKESPQIATTRLPSSWGRMDASQSDYSCIVNINAIKLNQGTQHYKRLRGHQDNPRLLLPTLLSWDDNWKHVSKTTQEKLKYWVSKVSDGSNLSKRGNMPGDIRESSRQRICEECAQSDVQLWWVSSHLLSKLLL